MEVKVEFNTQFSMDRFLSSVHKFFITENSFSVCTLLMAYIVNYIAWMWNKIRYSHVHARKNCNEGF